MKPQPVVITTICSLCDRPWEDHGDKPTTADCIRLLKEELAARPIYSPPVIIPQPYPVYPRPWYPWTWNDHTITCGTTTSHNGPTVSNVATLNGTTDGTTVEVSYTVATPDDPDDGPMPVAA